MEGSRNIPVDLDYSDGTADGSLRDEQNGVPNTVYRPTSYDSTESHLILDYNSFLLPLVEGQVTANLVNTTTSHTNFASLSGLETNVFPVSSFTLSSTLPRNDFTSEAQPVESSNLLFEGGTVAPCMSEASKIGPNVAYSLLAPDPALSSVINKASAHPVDWLGPKPTPRIGSPKKRGRPRKGTHTLSPGTAYCASYDPLFHTYTQFDHAKVFWCPICRSVCQSHSCPEHPISVQSDCVVQTFARLSRPSCIQLVEKSGSTCVLIGRKQPPLTRFGPLIGPLVTQTELDANPEFRLRCNFPIECHDGDEKPVIKYHHLADEARCNWMMFVRLVVHTADSPDPLPNAVAYQNGAEGLFFLTTRTIRAGEELVVTYAPPYAARFGLPQSVIATGSVGCATGACVETIARTATQLPDEIHCFRCTITFHSEDAFRIHCLGHPGDLEKRGISICQKPIAQGQAPAQLTFLEIRKSTECNSNAKPALFQSPLVCSLCSSEFGDLSDLIRHTDVQHSVSRPSAFRPKSFSSALKFLSAPGFDATDPPDSGLPRLDDSAQSETDFSLAELQRISPPLLDGPLFAYGCGQCRQQFITMQLLEQHKKSAHNPNAPNNLPFASGQLAFPYLNAPSNFNTADLVTCSVSFQSMGLSAPPTWTTPKRDGCAPFDTAPFPTSSHPAPSPTSAATAAASSDRGFSCDVCQLQLRTRSALAVHMRSHSCEYTPSQSTRVKGDGDALLAQTTDCRLRPRFVVGLLRSFFRCGVCGEGQRNQQSFQKHKLKHQRQSDLKYPCLVCPEESRRVYATFEQLQRHTRFVHPPKLFPCHYCARTFGRRQHLANHLTQHTGRRDFVCPYMDCKKAYGRKDRLQEHLKTHAARVPLGSHGGPT